jgi:hypothetical protein
VGVLGFNVVAEAREHLLGQFGEELDLDELLRELGRYLSAS